MKNKVFYIICVLILLGFAISSVLKNNLKYPEGKDTVKSFGDGTYQISSGDDKSLFNEKYGNCIIEHVEKFFETNNKAYLIGTSISGGIADGVKMVHEYKIYAVIELEDSTMKLCIAKNEPSQPDLFIYRLDEMIKNCDVSLIADLFKFSKGDLDVISKMEITMGQGDGSVVPSENNHGTRGRFWGQGDGSVVPSENDQTDPK